MMSIFKKSRTIFNDTLKKRKLKLKLHPLWVTEYSINGKGLLKKFSMDNAILKIKKNYIVGQLSIIPSG